MKLVTGKAPESSRERRCLDRGNKRAFQVAALASASAVILVCIAVVLYTVHFYKPHFQSDDAVLSLLAESMWEQGVIFPRGWIVNSGDLMVPSGALLIAPLLSWLPNGFHAHAIAVGFALLLMAASFMAFLRQANVVLPIRLVALAAVVSGLSWLCAHAVYQQTTYVWWPAAFFIGATLILKYRFTAGSRAMKFSLATALFAVVFVICLANPGRTVLMLVLPLYTFDRALAGDGLLAPRTSTVSWLIALGCRDIHTLVSLGGGFLCAALCYAFLMGSGTVSSLNGISTLYWEGWGAVAKHFYLFVNGWPHLLGGSPSTFDLNASLGKTVLEGARIAFGLWLTAVAVLELVTFRRQTDPVRRALTLAFLAAFLPVFFIYILLSPLAVDASTMRYFIVPFFILLAQATLHVASFSARFDNVVAVAIVAVAVMLVATSTQRFVLYGNQPISAFWRLTPSPTMQLGYTLKQERLVWGYASWWNAGATTVMADSAVRVSPVTINRGIVRPYPVMTQKEWFSSSRWQGETFLALDAAESSERNVDMLRSTLGEPTRVVNAPYHKVFVYDYNIMNCALDAPMTARLDAKSANAEIVQVKLESGAGRDARHIMAKVRNRMQIGLSGTGAYPISIGLRLVDADGVVMHPDWVHWLIPCPVDAGTERRFVVPIPPVPDGTWTVQVDLVQEGVAWFHQWGGSMASFALSNGESGGLRGDQR